MRASVAGVVAVTWLCALSLSAAAHVGRDAVAIAWFTAAIALIGTAQLVGTAFGPRIVERLPSNARPARPASDRIGSRRVF